MALGVSRSNVLTKKTRSTDWADLRKSPPKVDDADLKDAITCVVKESSLNNPQTPHECLI
jgi:hypothetical protein